MNHEKLGYGKKSFASSILLSVIIPLLIGTVIYLVARDRSVYFLKILHLNPHTIALPGWIKFNLPDGLWAFALSSLISIVWKEDSSKNYYLWFIIVSVLSILMEVLYGTFDIKDIAFISVGLILPFLFRKQKFYNIKTI
ncbi:hypothetical protein [Chryseobacterium sp. ERMR1:04]|uniref:hypothetical protein n=1 Tax=Chryseobacterium sp. ERMR1:04 TaxID=1705393 RepID=UPI0006C8DE5B|nr:hypothetical protein [Chryseobacterium sp. ERMR1:04]KPH10861.1 hypothetical protein AMQ68_23650 [Chryseobacterium sp. ERMR1:04]